MKLNRICIIGAGGAIGGFIASLIANYMNHHKNMINLWLIFKEDSDSFKRSNKFGIVLQAPNTNFHISPKDLKQNRIELKHKIDEIPDQYFDFIFCCLKDYSITPSLLKTINKKLDSQGLFIHLQNGIPYWFEQAFYGVYTLPIKVRKNDEECNNIIPLSRTISATCVLANRVIDSLANDSPQIIETLKPVGNIPMFTFTPAVLNTDENINKLKTISPILLQAHLSFNIGTNVIEEIIRKAQVNVAINALSTLCLCTIKELLVQRDCYFIVKNLFLEVASLGECLQIELIHEEGAIKERLLKSKGHLTSMAMDRVNHKKLEVDALYNHLLYVFEKISEFSNLSICKASTLTAIATVLNRQLNQGYFLESNKQTKQFISEILNEIK